jgi:hypothetical protein
MRRLDPALDGPDVASRVDTDQIAADLASLRAAGVPEE